tara:strand:+ start:853 stop:2589 length:1737 start_codon:yes stop_codon:yes gene_type:complete
VALIGLDIPAGLVRNGTDLESSGRWLDANLIRWENNSVRPVGGWEQREVTKQGGMSLANATSSQLHIYTTTPHGLTAGDTVTLSGLVPVSNVEPNGIFSVNYVYGSTHFRVYVPNSADRVFDPANGVWSYPDNVTLNAPPRGSIAWSDNNFNPNLAAGTYEKLFHLSGVSALTDITPTNFVTGSEDSNTNSGFGGYYYGLSNFGTQRPDNAIGAEATSWSVDNWGEYLVAVPSNDYAAKTIYEWQLNPAAVALPLANSPKCNSLVVSEDRFILALAADDDPRLIRWCDREVNTLWTGAATNEAGQYTLNSTGEILLGLNTRGRVLILTTTDAHAAAYSGPPVVYGFEQVGSQCGAISRHCAVAIDEGAFWMSYNGFFAYNGSAVVEMPCDVQDYVFEDINRSEITKVFCIDNSQYNELWWFYPSGGSTENDRYVIYDYKERHWNVGIIDRTSAVDIGVFTNPIWFGADGAVYDHERGFYHGGSSPYIESGPISMGEGEQVMNVISLIPDEKSLGDVTATFKTRYYPTDTERSYGPFTMANPTSVRFQGRQIRMRLDGENLVSWKAGKMRIEVRAGSQR